MRAIYALIIRGYGLILNLAALFHPKAKLWVDGRKDWRANLKNQVKFPGEYYWFHCASLGEFEQGRPIMEALKEQNPGAKIALSFFSPSGFEIRKDYELADIICYLPLDTANNARDFIQILQPKLAVFVKYEIWPEFFRGSRESKIPLLMVSAIFRPSQRFFKFYGGWFRKSLQCPEQFFVQDQQSANLLKSIGIVNATLAGDTRFDRVIKIAANTKPIPLIENFIGDRKAIVVGSSWLPEERISALLNEKLGEDYCFILAPHEIDEQHVNGILEMMGEGAIKYSSAQSRDLKSARTLVIDNMGLLSRIYKYAHFVVVGGGFGKGLHNAVEAAVYGVPLAYGPRHLKFNEAVELVRLKAGITADSPEKLTEVILDLLGKPEQLGEMADSSKAYVLAGSGATAKVMRYLSEKAWV